MAVGIITPAPCFYLPIGRGGQRIRELEDASGGRIKVHITTYCVPSRGIYKYIIVIIIIKCIQHTNTDAGVNID